MRRASFEALDPREKAHFYRRYYEVSMLYTTPRVHLYRIWCWGLKPALEGHNPHYKSLEHMHKDIDLFIGNECCYRQ